MIWDNWAIQKTAQFKLEHTLKEAQSMSNQALDKAFAPTDEEIKAYHVAVAARASATLREFPPEKSIVTIGDSGIPEIVLPLRDVDPGMFSEKLAEINIPTEGDSVLTKAVRRDDWVPDLNFEFDEPEETVSCLQLAVYLQGLCKQETSLYNAYEDHKHTNGSESIVTTSLHTAWQVMQNKRIAVESTLEGIRVPVLTDMKVSDMPSPIHFEVNSYD